jgi:hypothetical protein
MNTSIVHTSGALLLGDDDARYVDHTFHDPHMNGTRVKGGRAASLVLASFRRH